MLSILGLGQQKPPTDTYTQTPLRRPSSLRQGRSPLLDFPTSISSVFPPGTSIFDVADDEIPGPAASVIDDSKAAKNPRTSTGTGCLSWPGSYQGAYVKQEPEALLKELYRLVASVGDNIIRSKGKAARLLEVDEIQALHDRDVMDALVREGQMGSIGSEHDSTVPDVHGRSFSLREACLHAGTRVRIGQFGFDLPRLVVRCTEEIERRYRAGEVGLMRFDPEIFLRLPPPRRPRGCVPVSKYPESLSTVHLLNVLAEHLNTLSLSSTATPSQLLSPLPKGEHAFVPPSLLALFRKLCINDSSLPDEVLPTDKRSTKIRIATTLLKLLPTPSLGLVLWLMFFLKTFCGPTGGCVADLALDDGDADEELRYALEELGWSVAEWAFGGGDCGAQDGECYASGMMMKWSLERWDMVGGGVVGSLVDGETRCWVDKGSSGSRRNEHQGMKTIVGGNLKEEEGSFGLGKRPVESGRLAHSTIPSIGSGCISSPKKTVGKDETCPSSSAAGDITTGKDVCIATFSRPSVSTRQNKTVTSKTKLPRVRSGIPQPKGKTASVDQALLPKFNQASTPPRGLKDSIKGQGDPFSPPRRDIVESMDRGGRKEAEVSESESETELSIASSPSLQERLLDVLLDDSINDLKMTDATSHKNKTQVDRKISLASPSSKNGSPRTLSTQSTPRTGGKSLLPTPRRRQFSTQHGSRPNPVHIPVSGSGTIRSTVKSKDINSQAASLSSIASTTPTCATDRPTKPLMSWDKRWRGDDAVARASCPSISTSTTASISSTPATSRSTSTTSYLDSSISASAKTFSSPTATLGEAQRHIRALERELERSEMVVAQAVGETFRMRERVVSLEKKVEGLEGELKGMAVGVGRAGVRSGGVRGGHPAA